jgi:hypothetical protein
MNSKDFVTLYSKQEYDETITPFENEVGFSLIRFYPQDTPYFRDDMRLFIKVAVLERGFFYEVNMTRPEKHGEATSYVIKSGEDYKERVTSFISEGEEFVFEEASKKVVHISTKKNFSLNEFIDIIEGNHLADRLFLKRGLNIGTDWILRVLFWLSDKRYEKITVSIDRYHFTRDNKPTLEEHKNIEPFFKYFYISKNMIFGILLLTLFLMSASTFLVNYSPFSFIKNLSLGDFSLSNPLLVLLIFLVLFTSEKLSLLLNRSISRFTKPEQNHFQKPKESFIEKLHNFQYQNKFNLKLKLRTDRNK